MSTRSVHAELSIPEGFADGRMTEWSERILLPAIPRWATTDDYRGKGTGAVGPRTVSPT
jgi:hypothetical protein